LDIPKKAYQTMTQRLGLAQTTEASARTCRPCLTLTCFFLKKKKKKKKTQTSYLNKTTTTKLEKKKTLF